VKPYDAETDLNALAKTLMKEITMDGLLWREQFKLEPVAFGVKKLVIGCVVEDDKVSPDDLQEKIEEYDELVQSVEIATFTKV